MLAFISIALVAAGSVFFRPVPAHRLDEAWGDYPEFLAAIRTTTQNGDTIALLVPARRGSNDYSYAYFRASYFLAGREVLPVIDDNGRIIAGNVRDAQFVAAWHGRLASERPLLWRAHGGELHGR
jgi:hypothetical protein